MKAQNTIVIMADEHRRDFLGCAGHKIAKTPHLDALAARGTRFTNAYTPSPICVPARSAFATGKLPHEIGAWCNAFAYTGAPESWHHKLRDAGHHVRSIGKLHFRGHDGDDNGFSVSEVPMNIVGGVGDALGLLRDRTEPRGAADKMAKMAGPGESVYTTYDREISKRAQRFIREDAPAEQDKPWALFVSFVCPHFPLTAPQEFYDLYNDVDLPLPGQRTDADRPNHPYLSDYRRTIAYDDHFKTDADVRRAMQGYLGLVSFIDAQVGAIVAALEETGQLENTRIVYTSDHGDNLGTRGLWGKSNMYEESAGIPLIVAGADIAEGAVRDEARSLIDVSRFVLQSTGLSGEGFGSQDLFGDSNEPVFSEYHATGSRSGAFMLRHGDYKYVHYALYEPQLFDLKNDPNELTDVANDPAYSEVLQRLKTILYAKLHPENVHQQAITAQAARVEELGGAQAIIDRGDFGFSPPPGVEATFS
ncbi:sulfatase-like hydrolase/transferase [Cognatishimia sp. SS12]|uniref:sulfatase-like hydrolase/transferase n=1 Tax=Cognatishimia sp. SS12 TaxID=2979465 RepID=UPI00232ED499|nr:sulfatase-like hydrolase/transferase [Cognatishimia sp. SS12]MDC0739582.1 sulfatase-like hydrolase/transferase [Cognatishimia sp. SS12]